MVKQVSLFFLLVFFIPIVFGESQVPNGTVPQSGTVSQSGVVPQSSSVLQMYMQKFSRADLAAKVQILEEAASDSDFFEYSGQLFEYGLQFVLDNAALLKDDPDMIKLAGFAVSSLRNAGYSQSAGSLWKLFLEYPDSAIGIDSLITLGKFGKGNRNIIDNINNYLLTENMLYRSGDNVNYAVISACISAIMELGDIASYPVLLDVMSAGYPEVIVFEAEGAFELIPANPVLYLLDVIENNPPGEKLVAFRAGIHNKKLNIPDRGRLAELALEQSLTSRNAENADLTDLRYEAALALTPLRWTRANPLAIRHYYRVQTDFQHHVVTKDRFIEAIKLLGAVGNSDAALVLGLHLGLINARFERTGEFDEEITLAIVRSLGFIGDKDAFDHLLNISSLSYGENIQAAATEAINHLRW